MPVRFRSPNHIDPTFTFTAFLVSVLVGARQFAHVTLLRGDRALHALLGMNRFSHRRYHPQFVPAGSAWARYSGCSSRWRITGRPRWIPATQISLL